MRPSGEKTAQGTAPRWPRSTRPVPSATRHRRTLPSSPLETSMRAVGREGDPLDAVGVAAQQARLAALEIPERHRGVGRRPTPAACPTARRRRVAPGPSARAGACEVPAAQSHTRTSAPSPTATSLPSGEKATSQLESGPSDLASLRAPECELDRDQRALGGGEGDARAVGRGGQRPDRLLAGVAGERLAGRVPHVHGGVEAAATRGGRRARRGPTRPRRAGRPSVRQARVALSQLSTKPPAPPTATRAPSGEKATA